MGCAFFSEWLNELRPILVGRKEIYEDEIFNVLKKKELLTPNMLAEETMEYSQAAKAQGSFRSNLTQAMHILGWKGGIRNTDPFWGRGYYRP